MSWQSFHNSDVESKGVKKEGILTVGTTDVLIAGDSSCQAHDEVFLHSFFLHLPLFLHLFFLGRSLFLHQFDELCSLRHLGSEDVELYKSVA